MFKNVPTSIIIEVNVFFFVSKGLSGFQFVRNTLSIRSRGRNRRNGTWSCRGSKGEVALHQKKTLKSM